MSNSSKVVSSITETQIKFAFGFAQYCTIPGACVCFLVLVASSFGACFSRSRQYLDRVSFRLIIYALISHVLFGIAFAAAPVEPGPLCNFAAFISNVFVCYSTFLTTCIAINLQLVVVHHVNGLHMEKYYLIAPTLVTIVLNVPTYALGQFGWDSTNSVCWYKNPNHTARLHWMIATESFPLALAATIETVCSCILLLYMYLVQRSTEPFFMPFILSSIRSTSTRKATNLNHVEKQRQPMSIAKHSRYRKAILRIVLYPITSLLVNFIIVSLDLNSTIRGVHTELDYRLLILGEQCFFVQIYNQYTNTFRVIDLCLVGMRTLPYGLLAAFDPALTAAMRELLKRNETRPETPTTAPIVTENRQRPQALSYPSPQGLDGVETQSRLNAELTSVGREMISTVAGENENENRIEQRIGVERIGQESKDDNQYDYDLEFPIIGRQI